MGSIYVICSRQCPNGDGIYTLLYALYKYSTSITNQPTKASAVGQLSLLSRATFSCRAKLVLWPEHMLTMCLVM